MEFRYEITIEEYVAGQSLYRKLSGRREIVRSSVTWIVFGVFVFIVARSQPFFGWLAFLMSCLGLYWVYLGILTLYPARFFRRTYGKSGLGGASYSAELDANGFQVAGDLYTWKVLWPGVKVKGEDKLVFVLYAANTIFIFGKNYLTPQQQEEVRTLAGFPSRIPNSRQDNQNSNSPSAPKV
jgi:hypothetical protein